MIQAAPQKSDNLGKGREGRKNERPPSIQFSVLLAFYVPIQYYTSHCVYSHGTLHSFNSLISPVNGSNLSLRLTCKHYKRHFQKRQHCEHEPGIPNPAQSLLFLLPQQSISIHKVSPAAGIKQDVQCRSTASQTGVSSCPRSHR